MPQTQDFTTYRRCRLLKAARTGTFKRVAVRMGEETTGRLVSKMPYAPMVTVRPTIAGRGEAEVPEWAVEWIDEA